MISILIPCYNYNATNLVSSLEKEALTLGIIFEIICIDDGSFSGLNELNQSINSLTNSKFIESKKNVGRTANRKLLSEIAQYNWLLFVDVDVQPKNSNFIKKYLDQIDNDQKVIFGGFAYKMMESNNSLRIKFGKKREEISCLVRNKNCYKYIISANFLISKNLFKKLNILMQYDGYGLDYLFGSILKQKKINVFHIDNEVYHLGLDSNSKFIEKTNEGINNLYKLWKLKKIKNSDATLLKVYKILRILLVYKIVGKFLNLYKEKMLENLKSSNPNLLIFDLYRLGYLCRIN